MRKKVDDHLENFDPDNLKDFTDSYIAQIKEAEKNGDESFNGR